MKLLTQLIIIVLVYKVGNVTRWSATGLAINCHYIHHRRKVNDDTSRASQCPVATITLDDISTTYFSDPYGFPVFANI